VYEAAEKHAKNITNASLPRYFISSTKILVYWLKAENEYQYLRDEFSLFVIGGFIKKS